MFKRKYAVWEKRSKNQKGQKQVHQDKIFGEIIISSGETKETKHAILVVERTIWEKIVLKEMRLAIIVRGKATSQKYAEVRAKETKHVETIQEADKAIINKIGKIDRIGNRIKIIRIGRVNKIPIQIGNL